MKTKLNTIIKSLLNIHKALLDLERANYESKNGPISNNHEYFSLVVNHEDFQWLRKLSEMIALVDEESEQDPIDIKKVKELLSDLQDLLTENENDEFSLRYNFALNNYKNVFVLNCELNTEIDRFLNN